MSKHEPTTDANDAVSQDPVKVEAAEPVKKAVRSKKCPPTCDSCCQKLPRKKRAAPAKPPTDAQKASREQFKAASLIAKAIREEYPSIPYKNAVSKAYMVKKYMDEHKKATQKEAIVAVCKQ
jgi:hypothetical protein